MEKRSGLNYQTLPINSCSNWRSQGHRTDASCFQVTFSTGSPANGIIMICVKTLLEQYVTWSTSLSTSADPLLEINQPSPRRIRRRNSRLLSQTNPQWSIKMIHLAQPGNSLPKRLLHQFKGWSRKRWRNLSLLRLLILPEVLLWVLPLLMLLLVSTSSLLTQFNSPLIPSNLFFLPSNSETCNSKTN